MRFEISEEANERCDHVVIPAANFLWKNFDFGYMADFLEKTNLPIIIIGVGAQTNDRTMASPIHPNTLRLMRLISDRSASIGVRGYYTAEVLAANGIHNVRVIGCPSIYTSR
ncbi:MAG: polysaccharide pyruvyl transferase family protein, partial [Candidatus Competibacteraceae bacterium]|nr:polysaccharide pyruvyl transferase family protein [Candidatus Competibacteraceae bacterium]